MLSIVDDALVHLCGELTSGRQHQRTWALVLAIKLRFGQNLQHRQTKGGSFASACLCAAQNITSFENSRYGAGLNWRRFGVALGFDGCNEFGKKSHF